MNNFSWILLVTKRVILSFLACFLISIVFLGNGDAVAHGLVTTSNSSNIYPTRSVHNENCEDPKYNCLPPREAGVPSDPQYPKWWISDWTMYRVFQNYAKFPPPYASPPEGLTPSDYEVSYGTTYYDSTYLPENKEDGTGAMMEYYKERCLPIFPRKNDYTCAFVSLGNKAYFLNYGKNPDQKPRICLFSPYNHPPRTDFIKHLPYNPTESTHVNNSLQAYSIRVGPEQILFGYAFDKNPTLNPLDRVWSKPVGDVEDKGDKGEKGDKEESSFQPTTDDHTPLDQTAAPYRHPQSFYFSGYFSGDPKDPPNAPIVSQNYTNFHVEQPALKIWNEVAKMVPPNPKECCLFEKGCPD